MRKADFAAPAEPAADKATEMPVQITRPTMTVDLDKVRSNYRRLSNIAPGAKCAAVVKGDAYGHGMQVCAEALSNAGAHIFFVASCEDGLFLRKSRVAETICVLAGPLPGEEEAFMQYALTPVVNDRDQILRWAKVAQGAALPLEAVLHFDTGMNRLGLLADDAAWLTSNSDIFSWVKPIYYMTHLSAADDLDLDRCRSQRDQFFNVIGKLPAAPLSIANSAATFFGPEFVLDLIRPGKATFGINPQAGLPNPMEPPATVHAPIIQVKSADRGTPVGYSSTFRLHGPSRIATVAIGYANGYPRSGSNRAKVAICGFLAPVLGRVSMDLITVDVSSVPEDLIYSGAPVEILGPSVSDSVLADAAETIAHEVLIALGRGCERRYINA